MARTMALDLPDDLQLPLRSGSGHWYWLGGRPALDLVNTLRERWRRRVETLVTTDDLAGWLVQAGLIPEPMPVRRAVLEETRRLREAIDAGVLAAVAGERPPADAVRVIDGWLAHAGGRPSLTLIGAEPTLGERPAADSPRRAVGTVALDAATMLGVPEQRARLRICGAEDCSARFYDRSPAACRRWCSMRTCGNAAKARRHRERRRVEA
ncbi:MAG TPA: CGNR zinc finger domain-containing protein [Solirubrobacteraceae bacterium]|nr:CGNR zinc finger domain-containing protein [Solirubrobacteraceae bacterium]